MTPGVMTGIAGALALCLGTPAMAIETVPLGTISATIGEVAYEGRTLDVPSEGTATAEYRSFGPLTMITVQGHDPEADSLMRNMLIVEFTLTGAQPSSAIVDATVSWWPEGMGAAFFHSDDSGSGPQITLAAVSTGAEEARVAGQFSARLCRKDDFATPADPGDCRMVEGRFDTALRQTE